MHRKNLCEYKMFKKVVEIFLTDIENANKQHFIIFKSNRNKKENRIMVLSVKAIRIQTYQFKSHTTK